MNPHGNYERARCLLIGCCLFLAAAAIGVATDEPGASWPARAARLGALGPVIAGLSAAACAAQARRSGATRALLGLGVSPWQVHRGERQGAWLLGALGLGLVLAPWSEQASLFPQIEGSAAWQRLADGTLYSALGVSWNARSGFASAAAVAQPSVSWSLASLALLGPACAVVPPWVLSIDPDRQPARGLLGTAIAVTLTSALALGLVHAVAAQRLSAGWLVLSCAPLMLHAAWQRRVGSRWAR